MEVLDNELSVQTAEPDVDRALVAVNAAQDLFEAVVATRPDLLGGGIGTVVTAASTEVTAFPPGLLRIDRLQFIDPATNRPGWNLERIFTVGGHLRTAFWPIGVATTTSGRPTRYWTNGTSIFWDPLPNGIHTVRWYGFSSAARVTPDGTFAYPDIIMLPLASMATKLLSMGVGDDATEVNALAEQVFGPAVDALSRFNRDGAVGMTYTRFHDS